MNFFTISILFLLLNDRETRVRYSSSGKGLHIMTKQNLWFYECEQRAIARFRKQNEITFTKKGKYRVGKWMKINKFISLYLKDILNSIYFVRSGKICQQRKVQRRKRNWKNN